MLLLLTRARSGGSAGSAGPGCQLASLLEYRRQTSREEIGAPTLPPPGGGDSVGAAGSTGMLGTSCNGVDRRWPAEPARERGKLANAPQSADQLLAGVLRAAPAPMRHGSPAGSSRWAREACMAASARS